MSTILDIPKDELEFAKLAGVRLSMALEGMFTTGTGVMLLQPSFSGSKSSRLVAALIEILRSTGCRPGSESQTKLARHTEELDVLFSRFDSIFVTLADWRNMELAEIEATVHDLASGYCALIESLRTFLEFLGLAVDFSRQAAEAKVLAASFFQEVSERRVSE